MLKNEHYFFITLSIMVLFGAYKTYPKNKYKPNECFESKQGLIKIINNFDQKLIYKINNEIIESDLRNTPDYQWKPVICDSK